MAFACLGTWIWNIHIMFLACTISAIKPTAEENNIYMYIYMLERQVSDKATTLLDPFDVRVSASAFSFQHSAFSIPP